MHCASQRTWSWVIAVALSCNVVACGDDESKTGGGDTGGPGNGDGAEGADDESGGDPLPGPDMHGDQCGDNVAGWSTACVVDQSTATASDIGEVPSTTPIGAATGRSLCCEGQPPTAVADDGCSRICLLELCEDARAAHVGRCNSCAWYDCGFDMSDCLQGGVHDQTVACFSPLQFPFNYSLTVTCSAHNNEPRNADGTFGFFEQPENDTTNDPPFCGGATSTAAAPPEAATPAIGS